MPGRRGLPRALHGSEAATAGLCTKAEPGILYAALRWCGHGPPNGWAILQLRMYEQIVIVGGGQAAVQTVDTLRRKGFAGKLTVIGEEPWLPYQRPPLSKKYLSGALERERLMLRPAQFYTGHSVQTPLGRRVAEI